MSKPTDVAPVVGEGECPWNNPTSQDAVDTFLAIPGADDTEQTLVVESSIGEDTQPAPKLQETLTEMTDDTEPTSVVQSSIGSETQPVPDFHETLKEPAPTIHEFMAGVSLISMRKLWSSPSEVSTSSESSESGTLIISDRDRSIPYRNTDYGDNDISRAKRLHVGTFYVCKMHERRKSKFAYEDLGILLQTFDALGYKPQDDRNLTSQRVLKQVDWVFSNMDDDTMCTYSIFTLYK